MPQKRYKVNRRAYVPQRLNRLSEAMHSVIQLVDGPLRDGTANTPKRAAEAWLHWTRGSTVTEDDVKNMMTLFPAESSSPVAVLRIPFYSHCEHHLAPFFGHVSLRYIPRNSIVGLSKINRLVEVFAARLQVQERLTDQIAEKFYDIVEPSAVATVVTARHLCMESRGVAHNGHYTLTTSFRGSFANPAAAARDLAEMHERAK